MLKSKWLRINEWKGLSLNMILINSCAIMG